MSKEESPHEPDEIESGEFEIEPEELDDIEAAMREALKAVESVSVEGQGEQALGEMPDTSRPASTGVDNSDIDLEVTQLRAEVADLSDRSARMLADFDNFRKRAEKERNEERRFAASEVLRLLLPVIDNLERALSAQGSEEDLKVGVDLILRQIQDLLSSSGVERVQAMGEAFDPKFHEAVSRHEDPSIETPTVSNELQSGYTLNGRLLRPAVVMVAMPTIEDDDAAGKG